MKKYQIDYAVSTEFGEPLYFSELITCEDDVTDHEIVEGILKEHEGKKIISFSLRREA